MLVLLVESPRYVRDSLCIFSASAIDEYFRKHLIVSISSECYLTLPKGQLPSTNDPSKPSLVPGGGHLLIIPISHYPTLLTIPAEMAVPIISEIETYKSALRTMFAKYNACAVFFEVARLTGKGGHAHIQLIPVPKALEGTIEDTFVEEGKKIGIEWEEDAEAALASGKGNYFKVDLPDGRKMIHLLKPGGPFNIQFGRYVQPHFHRTLVRPEVISL